MLKPVLAAAALLHAVNSHAASVDILLKDAKSGSSVEYAVVSLHPAKGRAPLPARPPLQVMDQVDKEFVPHVLPIVLGTPVSFPNKDQIKHHVYSLDETKPFELKLYRGTPAKPVIFDVPGEVSLGCNIHDHMSGYIYVLDTPWYGMSGADGKVHIGAIPAGEYKLKVWQPRLKKASSYTRKIRLGSDESYRDAMELKLRRQIKKQRMPADWFTNPY